MSFQRSLPAVVAALTLLLAGCGQRGPLYFPDQHPPKKRLSQLAPGFANDTLAVLRRVAERRAGLARQGGLFPQAAVSGQARLATLAGAALS